MHVYRNILEHKTYDVIPENEFTLKNLTVLSYTELWKSPKIWTNFYMTIFFTEHHKVTKKFQDWGIIITFIAIHN